MFKRFKKKTQEQVTEPVPTQVTPLPPEDKIAYQVGKTECGKTTLRLGNGYSSGTLTMNDAGLVKLIDILEAALGGATDAVEGHDGRGPG